MDMEQALQRTLKIKPLALLPRLSYRRIWALHKGNEIRRLKSTKIYRRRFLWEKIREDGKCDHSVGRVCGQGCCDDAEKIRIGAYVLIGKESYVYG